MRPDGDVEADTEAQVDGLRNEAKGRIAEISGFASALEPLLEEGNERWWVTLARDDARFADVIGQLRAIVADFKDGERHQARADKRLLTTDDVRGLIDEFIEAYPHWRTVVEHVGGSPVAETSPAEVASVSPYPGYGARQRGAMATHAPPPRRQPAPLVAELREPDNDPQWQEVYDSALALYRRYETGRAARDAYLEWPDRTARLRDIYARYASLLGKVPEMVWARLFRDALLIPWSPSYVALTRLLADDVWRLAPAERQAEVARIATETGGDAELLAMAVDASIVADESLPALDV
jgi:hypothetical protein